MRLSVAPFAALLISGTLSAQSLAPHQQLAHDIYKELIEINTADSVGVRPRRRRRSPSGSSTPASPGRHLPRRPAPRQGQPRRPLSRVRRAEAAAAARASRRRRGAQVRLVAPISIRSCSSSATATTTAAARPTTRRWRRSSSPTSSAQEGRLHAGSRHHRRADGGRRGWRRTACAGSSQITMT